MAGDHPVDHDLDAPGVRVVGLAEAADRDLRGHAHRPRSASVRALIRISGSSSTLRLRDPGCGDVIVAPRGVAPALELVRPWPGKALPWVCHATTVPKRAGEPKRVKRHVARTAGRIGGRVDVDHCHSLGGCTAARNRSETSRHEIDRTSISDTLGNGRASRGAGAPSGADLSHSGSGWSGPCRYR